MTSPESMRGLNRRNEMSKITYDGQAFDMEEVRSQMDESLAEGIHGTVDTDQDFFDAYLLAHNEKFGERFVVR
jgi:hypothetical protein